MSLTIADTRTFPTSLVLCVATQTVPDAMLMPEVYRLLEFMTGGPVPTERLAEAMYEAHRFLVHRHPRLVHGWEGRPEADESGASWFAQKMREEGEALKVRHI